MMEKFKVEVFENVDEKRACREFSSWDKLEAWLTKWLEADGMFGFKFYVMGVDGHYVNLD
jgi:hypothetical protein